MRYSTMRLVSRNGRPAILAAATVIGGCAHQKVLDDTGGHVRSMDAVALRDEFKAAFKVGAAVNENQFSGRDTAGVRVIRRQFNTISPENVLKWEVVHPRPGTFDFSRGDRYVEFGESTGMFIVGHCLVWHSQTPTWVFQDAAGKPLTRDALLERMHEHIATVVGRYKGRIKGWDVVNEALNEDGTMRRSQWYDIMGDDFIIKAFQFAHEADPAAELYYNDYSLENAAKRRGAIALVNKLKAAGVAITAVGSQSHDKMDWPTVAQQDSTIVELAATGVKVNISEFDVDVLPPATQNRGADVSLRGTLDPRTNPYPNGLPDSIQTALANRYASLFRVFLAHRNVMDRVTFWGVGDADSWLNNWPVRGRTSYPLLFDRQDRPKPAFDAVVRVTRQTDARR
jgi:endo-1,4-beta-xylanase